MGKPLARHGHWKASDHTYLLWAQVNSIIVHWAAAYSGLITMITMRITMRITMIMNMILT